jgi:hypothetical protein
MNLKLQVISQFASGEIVQRARAPASPRHKKRAEVFFGAF